MKVLPRLVGNVLVKIGKFPVAIPEGETVASKVAEVKSSVKYVIIKLDSN